MAHDIAEEASIGALPFQDAQWLRSGNGHVPDLDEQPRGDDGPDSVEVHRS